MSATFTAHSAIACASHNQPAITQESRDGVNIIPPAGSHSECDFTHVPPIVDPAILTDGRLASLLLTVAVLECQEDDNRMDYDTLRLVKGIRALVAPAHDPSQTLETWSNINKRSDWKWPENAVFITVEGEEDEDN